ncbi:MAG: hypothetical protein R3E39_25625 [Anaerolineae bacterium]
MRKYVFLTFILLLVLSLSSIGGVLAQDGALIVAADVQDVLTLDPARAYETVNLTVFHAVYETLVNTLPLT